MLLAFLAFFPQLTGCATRANVWELEDRVERLEKENARLRQAVSDIGADISEEAGIRHDLGGFVASHRAEMYEIRSEIRSITGAIEEMEYARSRDADALKSSLEDYDKRFGRLETYVGMGVPTRSENTAAKVYPTKEELGKLDEQALYNAAKKMFDDGAYDRAIDGFTIFLQRFPKSGLADNSRFWIGEIYFAEEWYERAIVEYQKVIDDYPQGNKVPGAYLKQGIAFSLLGEKSNATYVLNELIRKFPDQNEAKIAKTRLAEIGR
jgi:tol-pal system protein YbgF